MNEFCYVDQKESILIWQRTYMGGCVGFRSNYVESFFCFFVSAPKCRKVVLRRVAGDLCTYALASQFIRLQLAGALILPRC